MVLLYTLCLIHKPKDCWATKHNSLKTIHVRLRSGPRTHQFAVVNVDGVKGLQLFYWIFFVCLFVNGCQKDVLTPAYCQ